ncbi:MAG: thioredoxin domain-containing protein [Desulfobacterales bacterium]|nr:thioredoxin domain-containing protein [Desulfobacterales bacterium]MDD4072399.1 thioredoxin domain-containing protein [Desulfobacterales bacterium]MDD4393299.1 thioredoxin domain-containing protein [Desulfobacterales bacterium]
MAPNRLIHEKSPYLLQHAQNPVDWYPWSDEAFRRARDENKPVFLSIGYSTCHWCHVMEKESFENPAAARHLNDTFVCIKVDREERPDIDSVYMQACQMLTGRGGWPLTIFMAPDKQPFFAATYIPVTRRMGQPGLIELCQHVKRIWATQRETIIESARNLSDSLTRAFDFSSPAQIHPFIFDQAYRDLELRFDSLHGGFNPAPKFPPGHPLQFLLRYYHYSANPAALEMVEKTLTAMRLGGIWDHVGFGFHRYSTDRQWILPHFEKMLYDQALMAMVYLETFQLTRDEFYARCAQDIFTYVLRDMVSDNGGFFTGEDADSEGEEGRFYVWRMDQIRRTIGELTPLPWERMFNLDPDGNYVEETTGHKTGSNILYQDRRLAQWARELDTEEAQLCHQWTQIREKLFAARNRRPRPLKDDKILTSWNGLMISALALGARVLNIPKYACASQQAAHFILTRLKDETGRLLHRFCDNDTGICANANDYAFFISGLIQLYQASFDPFYLKQAVQLQHQMSTDFQDPENGGFFLTSAQTQDLPVRPKELYDGSLPSANSVSLSNLLLLARLTGEPDWEKKAHALMHAFSGTIQAHPSQYTHFMTGLDLALNPGMEIVIAGEPDSVATQQMLTALNSHFIPRKVVLLKSKRHGKQLAQIAPYTASLFAQGENTTAFVCRQFSCHQPTTDAAELSSLLQEKEPPA